MSMNDIMLLKALASSSEDCYANTVYVQDSKVTSVRIGIPEYNKDEDMLSVTLNTKQLKRGVDYTISADGKTIEALDGITWNSSGYGVTFTFLVIKVQKENDPFVEVYDTIGVLSNRVDKVEENLVWVIK